MLTATATDGAGSTRRVESEDDPPRPFVFPADTARNIARINVQANLRLAYQTGLSPQDLIAELTEEIWAAFHCVRIPTKKVNFKKPRRCTLNLKAAATPTESFAAWAHKIAWTALNDRARTRRYHHTAFNTATEAIRQQTPEAVFPDESAGAESLEILKIIPRRLNRATGAKAGRIGHPPAAYLKALAHRERHQLSYSQLSQALRTDADLLATCGFTRPPHRRKIIEARKRLERWAQSAKVLP